MSRFSLWTGEKGLHEVSQELRVCEAICQQKAKRENEVTSRKNCDYLWKKVEQREKEAY